jgi:L-ascorbate metabolism protein UlaG (beta-lactamase superfamily)
MMILIIVFVLFLILAVWGFMQKAVFGKDSVGARLERVLNSPNYKNGAFQNINITSVMAENASYVTLLKDYFNKPSNVKPPKEIPSIKTNLKNLIAKKPTIVWFGHSSYFIKSKETTILIDPVFSGSASPVSFMVKSFEGSNGYQVDDFPAIDILFLSHDHYDHLDFETILKLQPKVHKFYTSLGVGAHLELWGVSPDKIVEFDWWESIKVADDIVITATPARHFSGRGFIRAKSLWSSFVLNIHGYNLFLGGDSGYDTHFKIIGENYGPFDIAMLENGQYNVLWHNIHTLPEETFLAARDLKAKVLMPVHWAKFPLANHAWNEPIKRLKAVANNEIKLTTPMIGEPVVLDSLYPETVWWEF